MRRPWVLEGRPPAGPISRIVTAKPAGPSLLAALYGAPLGRALRGVRVTQLLLQLLPPARGLVAEAGVASVARIRVLRRGRGPGEGRTQGPASPATWGGRCSRVGILVKATTRAVHVGRPGGVAARPGPTPARTCTSEQTCLWTSARVSTCAHVCECERVCACAAGMLHTWLGAWPFAGRGRQRAQARTQCSWAWLANPSYTRIIVPRARRCPHLRGLASPHLLGLP